MRGTKRREATQSLLPLPRRRDLPSAAGLVGRDDDVDEPLEEVALAGVGRAPRELEGLVRLEPLAAPCERQAPLVLAGDGAIVAGRHGDDPAVWGRPFHP